MNMTPRTAFILQVHKNPQQVNKFIQQLTDKEQADVYIHIDKKSYEGMKNQLVKGSNVYILENRVNCEWGDISQIDATLLLLKEVLASGNEYDFVCLRSGQDLLVKNGFKDFLRANRNSIFLDYRDISQGNTGLMNIRWPKIMRKRYTNSHPLRMIRRILLSLYGKGISLFPNKNYWPREYSFYKGSQWFSIPFDVAKYINQFLEENPWYYSFFTNSLVPDESFFHTLILNSKYKSNVVNNHLFFIKWGETLSERNSPQDLISEDIARIEKSDQFFARKFEENTDEAIIHYFHQRVTLSKDINYLKRGS